MPGKYYKNQNEHSKDCNCREFVVQTGESIGVKIDGENELSVAHYYDPDPKSCLKEAYCDECLATVNLETMIIREIP